MAKATMTARVLAPAEITRGAERPLNRGRTVGAAVLAREGQQLVDSAFERPLSAIWLYSRFWPSATVSRMAQVDHCCRSGSREADLR